MNLDAPACLLMHEASGRHMDSQPSALAQDLQNKHRQKFRLWILLATNAEIFVLIGFSVTKILKKEKSA